MKTITPVYCTTPRRLLVKGRKDGSLITYGKTVFARPLSEWVFGTPYRHRQSVTHLSVPPSVIQFCQGQGVETWVVRFDLLGTCFATTFDTLRDSGWVQRSQGQVEIFLPLEQFEAIPFQTWGFVPESQSIILDATIVAPQESDSQQLRLPWEGL